MKLYLHISTSEASLRKIKDYLHGKRSWSVDPVTITAMVDRIRKLVETGHKIRFENSLSRHQVNQIFDRMVVVVARNIEDPKVFGVIEAEWRACAE